MKTINWMVLKGMVSIFKDWIIHLSNIINKIFNQKNSNWNLNNELKNFELISFKRTKKLLHNQQLYCYTIYKYLNRWNEGRK